MTATAPPRQAGMLDGVAYAGMFVFGIVMALLGAVMPVLSGRLSLGLGDVGTLFLVMNAAMLAASLVVGPAMDRFGMKGPLVFGAALVALGLVMSARAPGLGAMLVAVACLGFGGGAVNASANTLVADLHDDPRTKASALNLLGVFLGFGGLLLPLSIGALLSRAGLGGLLVAAAVLCAATAALALALPFPAPKQAHALPLADMARVVRLPLVIVLAFLLFFQSGNEFVLAGYFTTFLTRELSVPIGRASYLLAAYWAAIMMSRLLVSRVARSVGAHQIVMGGAALACAGALLIGVAPGTPAAVAGMLLTGLALAGIVPTVLGVAGGAFQEHSGTVFGILFTMAVAGGMTMPWLAGQLASAVGLRAVFLFAAANFVAVAVLNAAARRLGRAHATLLDAPTP